MDEPLFNLIWLIIIFIWLFLAFFKKKPIPLPKERPPVPEEEIEPEDLWETLGFPLPQPRKKPKPEVIVPKPKRIEVLKEIPIEKAPPLEKKEEVILEKEAGPLLSQDKLQEGIILSIILGPPNALRIRRGAGIGI